MGQQRKPFSYRPPLRPAQELQERIARLEKRRRLVLTELRLLDHFLAAHPDLLAQLPSAARGGLTRLRCVVDNSQKGKRSGAVREHLHREHLPQDPAGRSVTLDELETKFR